MLTLKRVYLRYIGKVLLKGSKRLLENYHLVKSSFCQKFQNFEKFEIFKSGRGTEMWYFCGENDNGKKLKRLMTTRLQVYQPIMIACWNESSIIAQGDIKEKPHFPKNAILLKKYLKFDFFFNLIEWIIVFWEIIDFDLDPNKSKPFWLVIWWDCSWWNLFNQECKHWNMTKEFVALVNDHVNHLITRDLASF